MAECFKAHSRCDVTSQPILTVTIRQTTDTGACGDVANLCAVAFAVGRASQWNAFTSSQRAKCTRRAGRVKGDTASQAIAAICAIHAVCLVASTRCSIAKQSASTITVGGARDRNASTRAVADETTVAVVVRQTGNAVTGG